MSDFQQKTGISFKREIGLGEVIALFIALGLGFAFFNTRDTAAGLTADRFANFQATVAANAKASQDRFDEWLRRIEGTLGGIQTQTSNIPDLAARVALIERQLQQGEVRDGSQDVEVKNLRERVIGLSAEVGNMRAASAPSLPGRPGIR